MKIVISTDDNKVAVHFGRCPEFTLLEIKNDKVLNKKTIKNLGHRKDFLPNFFHEKGVDCIIAGGMGKRASSMFKDKGIDTILGVSGDIDDIIDKLLSGQLKASKSMCKPGSGKAEKVIEKEN
jgi:predicted Fe-Mo cluster-binding NifX family protein